ncbi:MAG: phosphoribosylformylglycinamidine cyclo-ligase [Alkalispirochaeta sp.]
MKDEAINYRSAGVDVDAGQKLVRDIGDTVAATQGPEVLGNLGGFAGLYALGNYRDPILVSGTDGVGTKVELARAAGRLDTIGIDLVAMCVNDVICHGARPLFFLDYMAVDSLKEVDAAAIVSGVAEGCRLAGCALIGGETAEMPGVYRPGRFDLAGFAVGAVEREELIDGRALEPGMAVVGLASSGFHSNGYSLLRRLFPETSGDRGERGADALRDALLTPTRIYAAVVSALTAQCRVAGIAHITGGGWWENLPRLLGVRRASIASSASAPSAASMNVSNGPSSSVPEGRAAAPGSAQEASASPLCLLVDAGAVPLPEVCNMIVDTALEPPEAYRTFNMGLGLAVALPAGQVSRAIEIAAGHGIEAWEIGQVEEASGAGRETHTPKDAEEQSPNASDDDPRDPAISITGIPGKWRR